MKRLFPFSLITLLLGCVDNDGDKQNTAKRYDLAERDSTRSPAMEIMIDSGEEEGWGADLRISLTSVINADSVVTYRAGGMSEGKSVGLQISVPVAVPESQSDVAQIMTIKSIGEASDNLILLLQKLYKEKASTNKFISSNRVNENGNY